MWAYYSELYPGGKIPFLNSESYRSANLFQKGLLVSFGHGFGLGQSSSSEKTNGAVKFTVITGFALHLENERS